MSVGPCVIVFLWIGAKDFEGNKTPTGVSKGFSMRN